MRPELPEILRAYARDLGLAGPQYSAMAYVLREAAHELDKPCCASGADPAAVPIITDDGIPSFGRPCLLCDD